MGAKLGMAFLDHGFLRFSNFVQPRRAMLMRYIKVEKGGEVIGLENKQALKYGYGSMLNLRVFLTSSFGSSCYKNLRNACNYFNQANLLESIKFIILKTPKSRNFSFTASASLSASSSPTNRPARSSTPSPNI